jgi:hypothetical protein
MADDPGRRSDAADGRPDDAHRVADDVDRDPDGTTQSDRDPDGAADADAEPGVDDGDSVNDSASDASAVAGNERTDDSAPDSGRRPEVVVPMDLYKTVTVFSTLFSIALVVGGMIALDAATARATADAAEVNLPLAFLGVAAIVLGAATYAFASRFRAAGMGNAKDADDEG